MNVCAIPRAALIMRRGLFCLSLVFIFLYVPHKTVSFSFSRSDHQLTEVGIKQQVVTLCDCQDLITSCYQHWNFQGDGQYGDV